MKRRMSTQTLSKAHKFKNEINIMTADLSPTPTSTSVSSGAANALSLLLREDPLLIQHGLTSYHRGGTASNDENDDELINFKKPERRNTAK